MLETKPMIRIQNEYRSLLSFYEKDIRQKNISDFKLKALFSEVKTFWYKNYSAILFFLNNLEYEDNVAFLAGAVSTDIANGGHMGFALLGKLRIINDPLTKMNPFFIGDGLPINYERIKNYVYTVTIDMLEILDNFGKDFWIIPTDNIDTKSRSDQFRELSKLADSCLLAAFDYKYDSIDALTDANHSFESIEKEANPNALAGLVYSSIKDTELPLRERIERYCTDVMDYSALKHQFSEAEIFIMVTTQNIMQCLDIFLTASEYKMTPYIRNDVVIAYLSVFEAIITHLISPEILTECIVAYIAQRKFNFTTYSYEEFINTFGNGILVNKVILALKEKGLLYPNARPNDIANLLDKYYL